MALVLEIDKALLKQKTMKNWVWSGSHLAVIAWCFIHATWVSSVAHHDRQRHSKIYFIATVNCSLIEEAHTE